MRTGWPLVTVRFALRCDHSRSEVAPRPVPSSKGTVPNEGRSWFDNPADSGLKRLNPFVVNRLSHTTAGFQCVFARRIGGQWRSRLLRASPRRALHPGGCTLGWLGRSLRPGAYEGVSFFFGTVAGAVYVVEIKIAAALSVKRHV